MSPIRFEWHRRKAEANRRKHGVSFEEASSVFYDENAQQIPDPEHSEDEDRFVMLGMSERSRILVVVHAYRESVIRLISARKATRHEREYYSGAMR